MNKALKASEVFEYIYVGQLISDTIVLLRFLGAALSVAKSLGINELDTLSEVRGAHTRSTADSMNEDMGTGATDHNEECDGIRSPGRN